MYINIICNILSYFQLFTVVWKMKHLENTLSCQIKQCGMHTFCFLRLMSYVQPKTWAHESTLHGVLGLSHFPQTYFMCEQFLRTYFMRVIFLHIKGIAKDLSSCANVTWSIRDILFSANWFFCKHTLCVHISCVQFLCTPKVLQKIWAHESMLHGVLGICNFLQTYFLCALSLLCT